MAGKGLVLKPDNTRKSVWMWVSEWDVGWSFEGLLAQMWPAVLLSVYHGGNWLHSLPPPTPSNKQEKMVLYLAPGSHFGHPWFSPDSGHSFFVALVCFRLSSSCHQLQRNEWELIAHSASARCECGVTPKHRLTRPSVRTSTRSCTPHSSSARVRPGYCSPLHKWGVGTVRVNAAWYGVCEFNRNYVGFRTLFGGIQERCGTDCSATLGSSDHWLMSLSIYCPTETRKEKMCVDNYVKIGQIQ